MPDASQLLPPVYQNNQLFTEHYLEHRVTESNLWQKPEIYEIAKAKFETLKAKRDEVKPDTLKESQLENQYIHWVLKEILGHHFAVQTTLDQGDRGYGYPDLLFTKEAQQASSIGNTKQTPQLLLQNGAIVIGDAKAWGINLDKASGGKQSPAQQIERYLYYSELPWGILTDGRYWRLYERNSSKFNKYYQIDLESILEQGDVHKFYYFYLFFRQQAFTSNWLSDVLKGSQDYAESLRDSLEEEVFTALEEIAQGFLDYRRNAFDKPPTEDVLKQIYEESLVLLYRLLFVFYAESRGILPINNESYAANSLRGIARNAKTKVDFPANISADNTELYAKLEDLFFLIDAGDESLAIPAYNGKLFSGEAHRFLEDKKVGDINLSRAIHKLATIEVPRGRNRELVTVDYQDLDVGHLGTIYEKLLEYRLAYADHDLVTSGKNKTYKKAKANQTPTIYAGQVYLTTGNNERKITGSYYTPEYIVRFIVEKTLEPLLIDITQKHATLDENGNWDVENPEKLRDAILALNVLDPATGSGHFAVDVVVYIAEWLHELALDLPELASENDVLSYWMRQVASACIYAVDINPLAVELAKLSIWLKTLAKDKPLNFLDHHIRVGNSLVGTSLAEIEDLAPSTPKPSSRRKKISDKQAPLFGEDKFTLRAQTAVSIMRKIEQAQANDVSEVKEQERLYEDLRTRLNPYNQLATVWTARHFGLEVSDLDWSALYATALSELGLPPRLQKLVDEAQAIADQADMRFFHWDVAFPEVFFDAEGKRLENAGFDAVVGNPPYVRQERIQSIKPYLQSHYNVYSGTADLFIYFYELGIQYLRDGCRLGYITSGTFYNTNSARPFRQYIHQNAAFEWVANFGENQPFKAAEMVYPTIAILKPEKPKETFKHYFMDGAIRYRDMQQVFESADFVDSLSSTTAMPEWRFQSKKYTDLFVKIMAQSDIRLIDVIDNRIYRGIVTGLDEAYIINRDTKAALEKEDKSSANIIKPIHKGSGLRPWYQINMDEYIIAVTQNTNFDAYPAIQKYLAKFKDGLEKRYEPARGQCEWYELRPCSYYDEFDENKIVWSTIAKLPRFSWDESQSYVKDSAFMIIPKTKTLLGILQSRSLWFALSQFATPLRLRGGLWQYQNKSQFIERLPIPELTSAQESELAQIAETITGLANQRYGLHELVRNNLMDDFDKNNEGISTRVSLYEWWQYNPDHNFGDFLDELNRRFSVDLGVGKQRDQWRSYLKDQRDEHLKLTDQIIAQETRMNEIVYDAFKLNADERQLIEDATKYPYGAV